MSSTTSRSSLYINPPSSQTNNKLEHPTPNSRKFTGSPSLSPYARIHTRKMPTLDKSPALSLRITSPEGHILFENHDFAHYLLMLLPNTMLFTVVKEHITLKFFGFSADRGEISKSPLVLVFSIADSEEDKRGVGISEMIYGPFIYLLADLFVKCEPRVYLRR